VDQNLSGLLGRSIVEGLLMAHHTYKGGLVLSRPDHSDYEVWHPFVKVMWQDENGFHSHELVYGDVVLTPRKRQLLMVSLWPAPG
jgi:hypothetical protein